MHLCQSVSPEVSRVGIDRMGFGLGSRNTYKSHLLCFESVCLRPIFGEERSTLRWRQKMHARETRFIGADGLLSAMLDFEYHYHLSYAVGDCVDSSASSKARVSLKEGPPDPLIMLRALRAPLVQGAMELR